jgi:type II secretory pathway pseudopilin PulG
MKRAGIIIGIVLIGIAYVLGFWPQYEKAQKARQQLEQANTELAGAQARNGLYRLQHELLAVVRQTNQKNYGQASTLSTAFFDSVRAELPRQADPKVKTALESILQQRDAVTSALAKGDPSALGLLQQLEDTMFQVVGETMGTTASD